MFKKSTHQIGLRRKVFEIAVWGIYLIRLISNIFYYVPYDGLLLGLTKAFLWPLIMVYRDVFWLIYKMIALLSA